MACSRNHRSYNVGILNERVIPTSWLVYGPAGLALAEKDRSTFLRPGGWGRNILVYFEYATTPIFMVCIVVHIKAGMMTTGKESLGAPIMNLPTSLGGDLLRGNVCFHTCIDESASLAHCYLFYWIRTITRKIIAMEHGRHCDNFSVSFSELRTDHPLMTVVPPLVSKRPSPSWISKVSDLSIDKLIRSQLPSEHLFILYWVEKSAVESCVQISSNMVSAPNAGENNVDDERRWSEFLLPAVRGASDGNEQNFEDQQHEGNIQLASTLRSTMKIKPIPSYMKAKSGVRMDPDRVRAACSHTFSNTTIINSLCESSIYTVTRYIHNQLAIVPSIWHLKRRRSRNQGSDKRTGFLTSMYKRNILGRLVWKNNNSSCSRSVGSNCVDNYSSFHADMGLSKLMKINTVNSGHCKVYSSTRRQICCYS